ncbi:MAG TPA: D-alanine--D-alanine ligase [Clostridiales bacterium]|jgi:D-alanine-D-alanine ligase|nr:D-alanine--D-alanine ligase [Clostridiales bacterium]HCG36524.1 D-alanine--D-alanine ligase [Clostridiales bacterium]
MEDFDPLVEQPLRIGIVYNLKSGKKTHVVDAEAEYDDIETVYAIQNALESVRHTIVLLEADDTLPEKLKNNPVDLVFNIAEGFRGRGREAQIPAILNFYGIPYTGSDETALCIALDKALTKRLITTYQVPTPRFAILTPDNYRQKTDLRFPVILKPVAEGSSKGISDISIVENELQLQQLARKNLDLYGQNMLAEEYIEGREFTVGLYGNGEDVTIFPPMEIQFCKETQAGYHVYSYNVKQNYQEYISYACPANLTPTQSEEMMEIAKKVFQALGCHDCSRVDFRMSPDGQIYFIEINPLPGLAPGYSDFPMIAAFCGVEYTDLVNHILHAARKRLHLYSRGK